MPKRLHNRDILAPDVVANSTNSKRSDIQEHSFHGMQSLLCRPLSKCYPCPETSVTHVPRLYTCGVGAPLGMPIQFLILPLVKLASTTISQISMPNARPIAPAAL